MAVIELKVGHARVSTLSTHTPYLTAQRDALAACRAGDTRVTTLDRLAHALPDGQWSSHCPSHK